MPNREKLVLAYSGGLDTSVAIKWLQDQGYEVVALTIDLGEKKDLDAIQQRALRMGPLLERESGEVTLHACRDVVRGCDHARGTTQEGVEARAPTREP